MGSVSIFAGGYGSGKSEIAVNFALQESESAGNVTLADLDLVNPFFASRDVRGKLLESGVRLLAPRMELAGSDIPHLPPEVIAVLREERTLFIDMAGDEPGARLLGYMGPFIRQKDYELLLVVNPFRPFSDCLEGILEIKERFERTSLLHFTGLISNPNLLEETVLDTILMGHARVVDWSRKLELPIKYLTVARIFYDRLPLDLKGVARPLQIYLRPNWLR